MDGPFCPRCGGALKRSDRECTITREKFFCENHNCRAIYTQFTNSGHMVEASKVVAAGTALLGFAVGIASWYFGGSNNSG